MFFEACSLYIGVVDAHGHSSLCYNLYIGVSVAHVYSNGLWDILYTCKSPQSECLVYITTKFDAMYLIPVFSAHMTTVPCTAVPALVYLPSMFTVSCATITASVLLPLRFAEACGG